MAYVTVYEGTRVALAERNVESKAIKSFIAGGCASVASQTFVVPIDVVSQHMMLIGRPKATKAAEPKATGSNCSTSSHLNPLNIEGQSKGGSKPG